MTCGTSSRIESPQTGGRASLRKLVAEVGVGLKVDAGILPAVPKVTLGTFVSSFKSCSVSIVSWLSQLSCDLFANAPKVIE